MHGLSLVAASRGLLSSKGFALDFSSQWLLLLWGSSFSTQSITLWGVSPHVSKGARLLPWTELGPGRLRGGLDTDGLLCTEWLPSVLHGRLRLNRIRHSLLLKTVPMATHMGRWMQLSTCPLSARPEAPGGGEAGRQVRLCMPSTYPSAPHPNHCWCKQKMQKPPRSLHVSHHGRSQPCEHPARRTRL